MGRISEVFGKEHGLKRSDLEKIIIENELVESVNLEYKGVGQKDSLDDELAEAILVRPLVSFLNTIERRNALLIIGVNAKKHVPTDIEPVAESVLTAERVLSLVRAHIGSIPGLPNSPDVNVVPVKCGSKGAVYLIELGTWPAGAYYSRLSNLSYVREGDSSRKLTLPEFFELSRRLSGSGSSMDLDSVSVKLDEATGKTTYKIRLVCTNYGNRPGEFVGGFVGIHKSAGKKLDSVRAPDTFVDVSHLNPDWERMFSFAVNLRDGGPVYPGARFVFEGMEIVVDKKRRFQINTETNDGDGKTARDYRITPSGQLRATLYRRTPWGFK